MTFTKRSREAVTPFIVPCSTPYRADDSLPTTRSCRRTTWSPPFHHRVFQRHYPLLNPSLILGVAFWWVSFQRVANVMTKWDYECTRTVEGWRSYCGVVCAEYLRSSPSHCSAPTASHKSVIVARRKQCSPYIAIWRIHDLRICRWDGAGAYSNCACRFRQCQGAGWGISK